jgi:hypothetical protein
MNAIRRLIRWFTDTPDPEQTAILEEIARMRRRVNPSAYLPEPVAVKMMRWATDRHPGQVQKSIAWCPFCLREMISAGCRWWYSHAECVVYIQCPNCMLRSRWFGTTLECIDDADLPPTARPRARISDDLISRRDVKRAIRGRE